MGYIYRALEKHDYLYDVEKYGLFSSKLVYDQIKKSFDFLFINENIIERFYNGNLTKEEYNEILKIFKNIKLNDYDIFDINVEANIHKATVNNIIKSYDGNNEIEIYCRLADIYNTLNGHVQNGNRLDYNWISFTRSFDSLMKYYNEQDINKVAVIEENIVNGIEEYDGEYNLACDLSDLDKIKNNIFLNKKNEKKRIGITKYNELSLESRIVKYGLADNEVVYYNAIPRKRIVAFLDPLMLDLISNKIVNEEEYYKLSELNKYMFNNYLKYIIKTFISKNDISEYVCNEHYINNKSIKKLVDESDYYERELNEAKGKILKEIMNYPYDYELAKKLIISNNKESIGSETRHL